MDIVEKEIIEITGYKVQRKFSDRQDYLKSLFNAVQKLSNEQFDDLTDKAAEWANACVEAFNSKNEELPDFDEVEKDEDESEVSEPENEESPEESAEADEEPAEEAKPAPRKSAKKEKPVAAKVPPKPKKVKPEPKVKEVDLDDEPDVVLDKWGCMEGSKNARALAMFEEGATTREVKDAIGGTYYNILAKMVKQGHKMTKDGSVITITHMSDKKPKK